MDTSIGEIKLIFYEKNIDPEEKGQVELTPIFSLSFYYIFVTSLFLENKITTRRLDHFGYISRFALQLNPSMQEILFKSR